MCQASDAERKGEVECGDVADVLLAAATDDNTGPYVPGHRKKRIGRFIYPPVWSAKFQVTDYLLPVWWLPRR